MKKCIALLTSLIMLASLTACGGPSPTSAASSFLDAVKSQDTQALSKCYVNDKFDLFEEASNAASDEQSDEAAEMDDALSKVYEENLLPKMLEFDYTLSNEVIDGDKATVDVSISTYPLGSAFTSFFGEYLGQAFALAFSDATDEQMTALAANILTSKLDGLTEKSYEKTATLSLVKEDNNWLVDHVEGNKEVLNTLSGGLVDAVTNMSTAFGE